MKNKQALTVPLKDIKSATLRRIVEEVRHDIQSPAHLYDRIHNRHARS